MFPYLWMFCSKWFALLLFVMPIDDGVYSQKWTSWLLWSVHVFDISYIKFSELHHLNVCIYTPREYCCEFLWRKWIGKNTTRTKTTERVDNCCALQAYTYWHVIRKQLSIFLSLQKTAPHTWPPPNQSFTQVFCNGFCKFVIGLFQILMEAMNSKGTSRTKAAEKVDDDCCDPGMMLVYGKNYFEFIFLFTEESTTLITTTTSSLPSGIFHLLFVILWFVIKLWLAWFRTLELCCTHFHCCIFFSLSLQKRAPPTWPPSDQPFPQVFFKNKKIKSCELISVMVVFNVFTYKIP